MTGGRFVLGVCALVAGHASAQLSTWTNPAGGDWDDPANWDAGVPGSLGDSAFFPTLSPIYTIDLNSNKQLDDLTIDASSVAVRLGAGSTLGLSGATLGNSTNFGIVVNQLGGTPAVLESVNAVPGTTVQFGGTGLILLNTFDGTPGQAFLKTTLGAPLEIGPGVSVVGTGEVLALEEMMTIQGEVFDDDIIMRGSFRGNGPPGQAGVPRRLFGPTLIGATVENLTLTSIIIGPGAPSTLRGCLITDPIGISSGGSVLMDASNISTSGIIVNLEGGAAPATLEIGANLGLSGTVSLNGLAGVDTARIDVLPGASLSMPPMSEILGTGIVRSEGAVVLDDTSIEGVNGSIELEGNFEFTGTTDATGSLFRDATVSGGALRGVRFEGASTYANINVPTGEFVDLAPGAQLTLNQPVEVAGDLSLNQLEQGEGSTIRFDEPGPVVGSGTWTLNSSPGLAPARIVSAPGVGVVFDADATFTGTGQLAGDFTIPGQISGLDPFGVPLVLNGNLDLTGGNAANVTLSAMITGGLLTGVNSVESTACLDGSTVTGELYINLGSSLGIGGPVTNDGLIVVNLQQSAADAEIVAVGAGASITGSGQIILFSDLNAFDATMRGSSAGRLSIGVPISGRGALIGPIDVGSDINPNTPKIDFINDITLSGDVRFTASSSVGLEFQSAGTFDRFVADPFNPVDITLEGSISLALLAGYVPGIGDRFVIMETNGGSVTGNFASVNSPVIGNQRFLVVHLMDRVEAVWTCPSDVNADGLVLPSDFTTWLRLFNDPSDPNHLNADVNGDGSVTDADFTSWLNQFNAGCP